MLLTLLPLAGWAATDYGSITVGDYTVTYDSKQYVAINATTPASTVIPDFTVKRTAGGSVMAVTPTGLRYQTIGNKVTAISAPGIYFREITFTDGTADKVMYVPFYVSATYDVQNVNDAEDFAASLTNGYLKKYYENWPMCDVDWIYGNGANDRVILYPGQYPTQTPGVKNTTGSLPNWDTTQKDDAIAWATEIFGPTYASYNIAHTWAAFYEVESNRNTFGFVFPTDLEGNYNVEITDGTKTYLWPNETEPWVFPRDRQSSFASASELTGWGLSIADPASIKYIVRPTSMPEGYVTDESTSVDIHTVPVVINISSDALSYKDAQNEPTIESVTVNGVTYYETEWPQLFTLQYYKKVAGEYIAQNADQIQNAGTYAVALVSKGATDADRLISYMNGTESSKKEFSISKVDLQVTLANAKKEYGDADPTELTVTPGALPAGCTSIPTFTFNSLPREAGAEDVAAVYNYTFTLNDGTQTDITTQNYNVVITNQPTLTITKKNVALTYKDDATQPEKVYGIETVNDGFANDIKNPEKYALAAGSALVPGADNLAEELAGIATDNKVSYSYKYVNDKESANWDTKNNVAITGGAEHKAGITFAADASDKYLFTIADVNLKVKQAELTATGAASKFTYSKKETAALTYNAAAQSVTKKVVYVPNSSDPTKDVVLYDDEATSFTPQVTISYKYKTSATADTESAADMKTAGYYKAYVAPVANGNFYLEGTDPIAASNLDFTINKANLYVYVTEETISKQYTGNAFTLPTSTDITFQGLFEADKTPYSAAITAVVAKYGTATTVTNVKDYDIAPVVANDNALRTNYNVVTYPTVFKVTKKPITLTPQPMVDVAYDQVVVGNHDATTSNVTATNTDDSQDVIKAGDLALVLQAYYYVVKNQTYEAGKTYNEAISLALNNSATTAAKNMVKNFEITATAKADITISNGDFTIIVKDKPATYGDQLTWNSFSYLTSGLTNPAITVKYILQDKKTKTVYSQHAGDALPKNAGSYNILVDETNSSLEVANYNKPSAEAGTIVAGTLTIAPKEVTIVAKEVKVNEGASVDDLNTLGKSKVSFTGKLQNDVIAFALAFNEGTGAGQVELDGDGNLNSPAADDAYAAGYKIVAATADEIAAAANANYTFKFGTAAAVAKIEDANATGALKVEGATILIVDATSDDVVNQLTTANGGAYTLKIENHWDWQAGKWYTMVLPFEISVAKLSAAIKPAVTTEEPNPVGYAIVNRMDKANTTSNSIKFNLYMGTIPANEPFLIKAAEAIDFTNVAITGTVDATKVADPSIENATGDVKFTGLYAMKADLSNTERTVLHSGWYTNRKNIDLTAFEAYFSGCDAAARIYIEDLDENGITAVKTLSADQINGLKIAEGWYTVNGIKLQSAPTEKGVYINNGKKVVIK